MNTATIDWGKTTNLFEEASTLVSHNDYEQRVQAFSLGPPRMDWSVPEAFLAVMLGAALADREVTVEEEEQIKSMRKRSRILKPLSNDQVNKAHASAQQKLRKRGETALREASECIPHALRMPVFALAIDIILADGKLAQAEKDFIAKLAGWLQIEKGVEWQISHVMLLKNSC